MARNTTPVAAVVPTSPEGIIRVYVPGAPDPKLARSLAQKAHGFGSVGKTPAPVKASRGHMYDFAPVTSTRPAPAPVVPTGVEHDSAEVAKIRAQIARLTAKLDTLAPAAVAAPAPTGKREVPAFIREAGARKAAITCTCCRDLGLVRGVGANAGKPYKTQDGANAAKAAGRAVPCPSHKRAKRAA